MPSSTKDEILTLRLTRPEKRDLQQTAELSGQAPASLASALVREGIRRTRFPAIEFRDGEPGRVAYLAGTRWPIWMIVQLVTEFEGDRKKAAARIDRPVALLDMALNYAEAYPQEIRAALALNAQRSTCEGLRRRIPHLEKL